MTHKTWYEPIVEFAGHLIVGTVIFIMVALVATGLSFFVGWLEKLGAPEGVVTILNWVEYTLLVIDAVLLVAWVASTAYHAFRESFK